MSIRLPLLGDAADAPFPSVETALREPDGLLAMGGDLSPVRLLNAYSQGIFPWYSRGEPILWWSPDPRMVVAPQQLHVSTSLRKHLRRCHWSISVDQQFDAVVAACANTARPGQRGTWITRDMRRAYAELHRLGYAHSIEVNADQRLIGGIYGVAIGRMFFGESMFSHATNASKTAIAALCRALTVFGVPLLDGQVHSTHLASLGFHPLPRAQFSRHCEQHCAERAPLPLHRLDPAHLQPDALLVSIN